MSRKGRPALLSDPVKVSFWMEKKDLMIIRSWNMVMQELLLSGLKTQLLTMINELSPEEVKEIISINNRTIIRNEQENEEIRKNIEALSKAYQEAVTRKEETYIKTCTEVQA